MVYNRCPWSQDRVVARKFDCKISQPRRCRRWRSFATLLFFLAAGSSSFAQEGAGRVLIVLRQGLLAPEEISPRSEGNAATLWKLALAGTSVVELEVPRELAPRESSADPSGLAQVAKLLLPDSLRTDGDSLLLLELKEPAHVWAGEPPEAAGLSFEELYDRVAAAPPASKPAQKEEVETETEPPAETGEPEGDGPEKEGPAKDDPAQEKSKLPDPIATSRVTIVRVLSSGETQDLVRGRDRFLAHLVKTVGAEAHVFVVSCPRAGAGSLVATGPRLKKGKVLGRKKSFSLIESALVSLFQDAEKKASQHELFE
jgi:hypothetical protein